MTPLDLFQTILFVYTTVILTVSIFSLMLFQWKIHKNKIELSAQLRIHLFVWLVFLAMSLTYYGPMMVMFFQEVTDRNLFLLSLRGSVSLACTCTVGSSTMFNTIDRIISLLFPISRTRNSIHAISIAFISSVWFILFGLLFCRSYFWAKVDTTTCITFTCLGANYTDVIVYKTLISAVNCFLGLFFAYLFLVYYRKSLIRREKRKNYLVFWLFLTELFFTIIPSIVYIILNRYVGGTVASLASFCSAILYCTDGFITSLIYWRLWWERNKSVKVSQVSVFINMSTKV